METKIYIVVRQYDESSHNDFVTLVESRAMTYALKNTAYDNGCDYVVQEWQGEELVAYTEFYFEGGQVKQSAKILNVGG